MLDLGGSEGGSEGCAGSERLAIMSIRRNGPQSLHPRVSSIAGKVPHDPSASIAIRTSVRGVFLLLQRCRGAMADPWMAGGSYRVREGASLYQQPSTRLSLSAPQTLQHRTALRASSLATMHGSLAQTPAIERPGADLLHPPVCRSFCCFCCFCFVPSSAQPTQPTQPTPRPPSMRKPTTAIELSSLRSPGHALSRYRRSATSSARVQLPARIQVCAHPRPNNAPLDRPPPVIGPTITRPVDSSGLAASPGVPLFLTLVDRVSVSGSSLPVPWLRDGWPSLAPFLSAHL